jgi:hypothetical protein
LLQRTEEPILSSLANNQGMAGRDNQGVEALPHERVRELLKKYGRRQ